jgi:hypothetical protein
VEIKKTYLNIKVMNNELLLVGVLLLSLIVFVLCIALYIAISVGMELSEELDFEKSLRDWKDE